MHLLLKTRLRFFVISPCILLGALFAILFSFPAQSSICFLPDCGDKTTTPNTNQDAEKCKSEGYESFQNRVCHQYSIVEFCPYNSDYIKCNNKAWCTINDYIITECEPPTELFNKCPNGEEMYKECQLDLEEACMAEDPTYVSTCDAGWVIDPNDHCSLSDEFGHCCNTCPGFISKEELGDKTAVASCESCDGTKYIAASGDFNACEGFWDCQDGCEIGSETCVSFGVTKCKVCKRCEARCDLEECPAGSICEYENCTQRYCVTGCAVDMTYFCVTPETDCNKLGYVQTPEQCEGSGMVFCPYDNGKVYCLPDDGTCCRICEGFEAVEIPNGYEAAETCRCCGNTFYKLKEAECTGYQKCRFGPSAGAENDTCLHGTELWYKSCKYCPNGCETKTCPEGAICQYDACSDAQCPVGCKTGYTYYCNRPVQTCEELGYDKDITECSGQNTLPCPYDVNKVICGGFTSCYDYHYLSIPSGYISAGRCIVDGVIKYKITPNPCRGYQKCLSGPAYASTETCLSGTTIMYKECKYCPDAYEYKACPEGAKCNYDSCSATFGPYACEVNYVDYCTTPETDCAELGYYLYKTSCDGANILHCPYDTSMVICN